MLGVQAVRPPGQELQEQGRKGRRKEEVDEQIRDPDEQGNAIWSKKSEKTRNGERSSKVFQMWKRGTQEVGMPPEERKEQKERGSTTTSSMGKGEKAQWGEGTAPKGSSNVHGRVDYTQRSGDVYGVQRMRLQGNEDRGKSGTRVPEQRAVV